MFVQNGKTIDYVNSSGADIVYGAVISLTNCIGIAGEAIANGAAGSVHLEGVFELAAVNNAAFAVGDWLYWDVSEEKLTKVSTGNIPAGYCVATKAETGTTAEVKLIGADAALLAAVAALQESFVAGSRFTVSYPQVAAADVAKTFFIAPATCKIISAQERHVTVAGQAGTLQIEKLTSGEAPGAGDELLAEAFDLTSTANTLVEKVAVTTAAGTLAKGDALALKLASGAATSYALGTITLVLEWA